ncbi:MAG: alkaline phosphatase family protein [Vicinamibacterales bacterium]
MTAVTTRKFVFLSMLVCGLCMAARVPANQRASAALSHKQLLIVLDGLRPDYVTADVMPNLLALGKRGVVFSNHHAVFPTVTRVNASSLVTGAYPERHGLLGNAVFFPQVDPARFLDTSQWENLVKINDAVKGSLLTIPGLGEILQNNGKKLLVVGAGTTGASFVMNYKVAGGAILHTEFALPEILYDQALTDLGPPPPAGNPNDARNRRAVDTFLKIGIPRIDPSITIMWLSDPDTTAHRFGMGHPTTVEALRRIDGEIKHLQDGLTASGLLDSYNIFVTSDHGFATHTGAVSIQELIKPYAGTSADASPRVVAGDGAVYVRNGDRQTIGPIVRLLQKTVGVGAIFTRAEKPGSLAGWAEGTLSFDAARWDHERSADILYSPDWTGTRNQYGFAGTSASSGTAGHGSSSPFEIHNTLMAAGPDIRRQAVVTTPSGTVDLAPTLLQLLEIAPPSSMQGRILREGLSAISSRPTATVETFRQTARTADGSYMQTALFSIVRVGNVNYRYLDSTQVTR